MLGGGQYEGAPPAYDDETAQTLANSLFGGQTGPMYNPNLGGEGVFGTNVLSPNKMSRGKIGAMSEGELGMLQSILKAGVDMGEGRRVAIDPSDYFTQVGKSWVPTWEGGATGGINYR